MVVDIAICGAGAAGCALTIALARAGYSILVLEREVIPTPRPGESLPPEVRVPLAALGVWEEFRAAGHLSAAGNHAFWGEDTGHYKDFLFNPYGNGWHIDRTQFDTMLQRSAHTTGATIHRGLNESGWGVRPAGGPSCGVRRPIGRPRRQSLSPMQPGGRVG